MTNKNLFQEAIADAKAVREAALANAKAALEEALTPRLQSMLAARLNEMNKDEEVMEEEETQEEGFQPNTFMWGKEDDSKSDQNHLDESDDLDLAEILAELDENEDAELEEAKKKEDEEDEEEGETEPGEEDDEMKMPDNLEDLKALIQHFIEQEMEHENSETPEEEKAEHEPGGEEASENETEVPIDEELDLEELLAELDALGEAEDKEEMEEAKKSKHEKGETKAQEKAEHASKKEKAEKSEMKEALSVINTLRNELNEVNLLNAKLLYVNKIFKAKSLTESQKVKVIASFDKATTVKEAKVVFESLNAALSTTAKKTIKESMGFASRAAGVAPKKQIVESNDAILRMQKLANIIK